jgi:hypothetical protein
MVVPAALADMVINTCFVCFAISFKLLNAEGVLVVLIAIESI